MKNTDPDKITPNIESAKGEDGSLEAHRVPKSSHGLHSAQDCPLLFVFSASDKNGIARWVSAYQDFLSKRPISTKERQYLQDLAFSLGSKRSHLTWRSYTVAFSLTELTANLDALSSAPVRSKSFLKVGFVFTG